MPPRSLGVCFVYCMWMVVREKGRLQFALAMLLACTPVVVFYTALLRTFVAIPLIDDYTALLRFSLQWRGTVGIGRRALLLLRTEDGDYKLWLDHLCAAADVTWTGRLHLGLWMWVGNLLLLPLLWLLWRHTRPQETAPATRLLLFAPVSFLLFQLNYAETVNWAMAGLQNLSVILCSLAAVHLLVQGSRKTDAFAAVLLVLAVAGSANGFLLVPIAVWLLLRRGAYVSAACWCGLAASLFAAYCAGLAPAPRQRVSFAGYLHFFCSVCGGGIENMHRQPIPGVAMILGVVLLAALVLCVRKGAPRAAPFAFWSTVWLLLTMLLITVGRAGLGASGSLAGRYKIYCDLLMVLLYLMGLDLLREDRRRRSFVVAVFLVSVGVSSLSDLLGVRLLKNRANTLREGALRFQRSGGALPPLTYPEESHAECSSFEKVAVDVLRKANAQNIYTLPSDTAAGSRP